MHQGAKNVHPELNRKEQWIQEGLQSVPCAMWGSPHLWGSQFVYTLRIFQEKDLCVFHTNELCLLLGTSRVYLWRTPGVFTWPLASIFPSSSNQKCSSGQADSTPSRGDGHLTWLIRAFALATVIASRAGVWDPNWDSVSLRLRENGNKPGAASHFRPQQQPEVEAKGESKARRMREQYWVLTVLDLSLPEASLHGLYIQVNSSISCMHSLF